MQPYSILTVDLNDEITSQLRKAFDDKLAELGWKKMPDLTTVWYTRWQTEATEKGMIDTTKNDVQNAADAGKVAHYDASTAVCLKPVSWKK